MTALLDKIHDKRFKEFANTLTESDVKKLIELLDVLLLDSNDIYDPEFLKLRFMLSEMDSMASTASLRPYRLAFMASKSREEFLGKDLYNFNIPEISNMLKQMGMPSLSMVANRVSIYSSYVDYAIEQGYVKTNINPFYMRFKGKELINYVSNLTLSSLWFNDKTIRDLVSIDIDIQDKLMFLIMFYATCELDSLRYIQKEDIDFENNSINIYHKSVDRKITKTIPKTVIDMIKKAYLTEEYYMASGRVTKIRESYTPYLFVATAGSAYQISHDVVFRNRLLALKKEYPLKQLRPKNIYKSGVYRQIYLEMINDGLGINDIDEFTSKSNDKIVNIFNKSGVTESSFYAFRNGTVINMKKLWSMGMFEDNVEDYKIENFIW